MRSALLLALFALPAAAIWRPGGPPVPIDRMVTNLTAQLKEHPNDAATWLVLARLHSFAYFSGQTAVPAQGEKPVLWNVIEPGKPPAGSGAHLTASIAAYRKAIALDPKQPVAYLGLGWVLEQPPANLPEALENYRKAYQLAAPKELAMSGYPPFYEIVSAEAADRIVAIQNERFKSKPLSPQVRKEIEEMRKASGQLKRKPVAVTPLIFSFSEAAPLDALLAPEVHVAFDLDGLGSSSWPWLQPTTGILVWDPLRTGVITSGRQLFGNATWWMFFRDGFHALAALDDNHDGQLSGAELTGLAVWTDRNQNGISDPGEVVPIADTGIVRIAVTAGANLTNVHGIQFADARETPLYDWIAEPYGQTLTSDRTPQTETAAFFRPSMH